MQVTVTGGTGNPPVSLTYAGDTQAYIEAQSLAASIDSTYTSAVYYNPASPPSVPGSGYLIIKTNNASTRPIMAEGFGAVVDANNDVPTTLRGGAAGGQTVLAANGGLVFSATIGGVTLAAGGGNNRINLGSDSSASAIYTANGNDTIIGGTGSTTISAGGGRNKIFASGGTTLVDSSGRDTIFLASGGSDTIQVGSGGADLVHGPTSGGGAFLTFMGGASASTVLAGEGSYTIFGGAGGGSFHGGSAGNNSISAGSGPATLIGGGAGDTLTAGSGLDSLVAAAGNETLGGGSGTDIFNIRVHLTSGTSGLGVTDTVENFNLQDYFNYGGTRTVNLALQTYNVSGGSASFSLADGSKVVLEGYTGTLTSSNFIKH